MKTTFKFGPGDHNWPQQIQMSISKVPARYRSETTDPESYYSKLIKLVCEGEFTLEDIKQLHAYTESVASRVRDHHDGAEYPDHMRETALDDVASVVNTVFDAYTYVHEHIQAPITSPKIIPAIVALLSLTLVGCTTVYTPQGPGYPDDCGKSHRRNTFLSAPFSLVNNTHYVLDVYQNGDLIFQGLETGQVLPIRQPWTIALNFTVTVVGSTTQGEYAGSRTWYYRNGYPEVWTITQLHKPQ